MCLLLTLVGVPHNGSGPLKVAKKSRQWGSISRDDPFEGGQVLVVKKMCHLLTLVGVPDNGSWPLKVEKSCNESL